MVPAGGGGARARARAPRGAPARRGLSPARRPALGRRLDAAVLPAPGRRPDLRGRALPRAVRAGGADLPHRPRAARGLRHPGPGHGGRRRPARHRRAGGPRRLHAAGGAARLHRRPPLRPVPRGGRRDRRPPAEGRGRRAGGRVLPHRVRHREAHLGAALLPQALRRGPPRLRPLGRGPRDALGVVPRPEPGDRELAARAVPPRLPQPQPHEPRRAALLDRLPGRAHGPGHLRPRVAAARRVRRRAGGAAGRAEGALPAEGRAGGAARGSSAAASTSCACSGTSRPSARSASWRP